MLARELGLLYTEEVNPITSLKVGRRFIGLL